MLVKHQHAFNIKYQPEPSERINHAAATRGIKRMEEERETYIRLDFISLIAVPWRADSSEESNNGLFHMAALAKLVKGEESCLRTGRGRTPAQSEDQK